MTGKKLEIRDGVTDDVAQIYEASGAVLYDIWRTANRKFAPPIGQSVNDSRCVGKLPLTEARFRRGISTSGLNCPEDLCLEGEGVGPYLDHDPRGKKMLFSHRFFASGE